MTYHAKIISGGKVVIPAELRRLLGMKDGDRLLVEEHDGAVVIRTQDDAFRRLQDLVAKKVPPGVSLADELIAERRAENAREEEETRRWLASRK